MALAFVTTVVTVEEAYREAAVVLQFSVISAAVTFLLVALGGEGIVFLIRNHQEVVASQLLFYILSAGLIEIRRFPSPMQLLSQRTAPSRTLEPRTNTPVCQAGLSRCG
ncbi:hypothetical protein SAMN05216226_11330 [Halovenus aranensis]|uniref:Uncharacterized protein n=1 Tax=Halovenus aranensis TaxID=890420 RepID=A0A1G8Y3N0_9EURY|nr:hypothetical protein [Halovenus aranensis]SDJ96725.1 hypothetical protein SAMN05216226_11330 [Halovenus aranensis]